LTVLTLNFLSSTANGHTECANALRFDPTVVSICLAAKHGDWLVMKALLVQGVSINTTRRHISTKGKSLMFYIQERQ